MRAKIEDLLSTGKALYDDIRSFPAYKIIVETPIEIPAIVYDIQRRIKKDGKPGLYLLDHQEESNVVVGNKQAIPPAETRSFPHIKRPDPGRSWYHADQATFCICLARPTHLGVKDAEEEFSAFLTYTLNEYTKKNNDLLFTAEKEVVFSGSDLYDENMKQIFGTSTKGKNEEFVIHRACTYTKETVLSQDLEQMLQEEGYSLQDFKDASHPPLINYDNFIYKNFNPETLSAKAFYNGKSLSKAQDLQTNTSGAVLGSCVIEGRNV